MGLSLKLFFLLFSMFPDSWAEDLFANFESLCSFILISVTSAQLKTKPESHSLHQPCPMEFSAVMEMFCEQSSFCLLSWFSLWLFNGSFLFDILCYFIPWNWGLLKIRHHLSPIQRPSLARWLFSYGTGIKDVYYILKYFTLNIKRRLIFHENIMKFKFHCP